jgi:1-acyl-sn-glycerol-3-phosphate acyltransferase
VSTLRAWVRLLAMLIVTLLAMLAVFVAGPLGARLGPIAAITQAWSRALLFIMGVRVDASGAPPHGAWVVVANHLSYLDILVIASRMRCRFVAKSEVADWPVIGIVSKVGGTLFVNRGRGRDLLDVGRRIQETLDAGVTVAFFPEGTSTRGLEVEPFHAGLLAPAAKGGVPCLPVTLGYDSPDESVSPAWTICWWGEMTFAPHAWSLMKLRRIDATIRWAETPVVNDDRKALARELHAQVSERFEPVRQDPEPADNPWGVAVGS